MYMYVFSNLFYCTDWPSVTVNVDGACATSVKLSFRIITDQSTCHSYSYSLYLMSSGIEIPPDYRNASHYQFNELVSNTSHRIQVTFTDGVSAYTVSAGYANTLNSLRKFPK